MSLTLTDLLALVDTELDNYAMSGSASVTGDGETAAFLVAPLGCSVVADATFFCYVDGTATTAYTMDYASGVCTMVTAPTDGQVISWQFTYKQWTASLVTQAINAAIDNLFPSLYVRSNETVASAAEITCPTGTEYVVGVDTGSASAWKRLQRKKYDVFYTAGVPSIHFSTAPTGSVRVHYVARPSPLVSLADDFETVTGLPLRARDCVVSYACYYLLVQKMAPRVRSDVAIAQLNSGALLPSQMQYGAQGYMMRFQFQLASVKMSPWGMR